MPTHPTDPKNQTQSKSNPADKRASLQWVEKEFASLKIKDGRRAKRLKRMAADFHAAPGRSIPMASGGHAGAKAAYRLIEGGKVGVQDVLGAHGDAVLERVKGSGEQVLLAAQDTVTLNFARRPNTEGLGPIGNKAESGHGFFIHSTLCVGASGGEVFGLLGAEMWARDKKRFKAGPAGARNRKPIQEKESLRWLEGWRRADELHERLGGERKVVSVADREGDIYEGFALCLETKARRGRGADLLVRAQHDRAKSGEGVGSSWSAAEAGEEFRLHTIKVPRSRGRARRQARLEVRFLEVEVEAPAHKSKYLGLDKPLTLWLVVAKEVSPPKGEQPVCWRLWTTVEINDHAAAIEVLGWYSKRWQMEEFHRILKSGCKVEDRQLESLEKLKVVAALDMVVAVGLLALTKAARRQPGGSALGWLTAEQCRALHCYCNKTQVAPQSPPTLGEAVFLIAKLGGFLGRKGDGFPGPQVLWRGWRRLEDITTMFGLLNRDANCG